MGILRGHTLYTKRIRRYQRKNTLICDKWQLKESTRNIYTLACKQLRKTKLTVYRKRTVNYNLDKVAESALVLQTHSNGASGGGGVCKHGKRCRHMLRGKYVVTLWRTGLHPTKVSHNQ